MAEISGAASSEGLPIPFVHWLRDFLSNHTARVQMNGERGDSAPLTQGLPFEPLLSALLFLLYLSSVVPETTKAVLVADDVSLTIINLSQRRSYKVRPPSSPEMVVVNICSNIFLSHPEPVLSSIYNDGIQQDTARKIPHANSISLAKR